MAVHAYEDATQRKNTRTTSTSTLSMSFTMTSKPAFGDTLVLARSAYNGTTTINAPTFGSLIGPAFTAATTLMSVGSGPTLLQFQVFYYVVTAADVIAGTNQVFSTQTVATSSSGYSFTVVRNVNSTSPIDLTSVNSTTGTAGQYTPFPGSIGSNVVHTSQGAATLIFMTLSGNNTLSGAGFVCNPGASGLSNLSWPLTAGTTADVFASSAYWLSDSASETTATSGGPYLNGTTGSRPYCCAWISFNRATYPPGGFVPVLL